MTFSDTLLELLELQSTIVNTQITIIRTIEIVAQNAAAINAQGRSGIATDVNNLKGTAQRLAKEVMSRSPMNVRSLIVVLEGQRLSVMKHDPSSMTRADVANLSQSAKLLVSVMRVLPDMYDAALKKAVSLNMHQG